MKKTRINWEFRQINQSGNLIINDPPAEIRFFYNLQNAAGTPAVINNAFKMDGYNNYTVGGVAQENPFELILINNKDEEDFTKYTIFLPPGDKMTVAIKYILPNGCE